MQHISPIEDYDDAIYDKVIALNLSACFHTMKHTIPQMKQAGWGRIVNVASVHGGVASINKSVYVASKHGVVGITKAVALELA
jgi:3-hydroxybutyrate dehydrogenase